MLSYLIITKKFNFSSFNKLVILVTPSLPVHVEIITEEIRRKNNNEGHLPEHPSQQNLESSAQIFTVPDSPEQRSKLPLPQASESSSGILTLPESQEKPHELGKTEGLTESSTVRDTQSNEGLHSKKRKFHETFIELVTDALEILKKSKSHEERNEQLKFVKTLADTGIQIKSVIDGSIIMILKFESIAALLCFGALYNTGMFKNILEDEFITQDYLASHGLSSLTLRVEVKKEDYQKCLEMMRQGKHYNISFLAPL